MRKHLNLNEYQCQLTPFIIYYTTYTLKIPTLKNIYLIYYKQNQPQNTHKYIRKKIRFKRIYLQNPS